eukprot:TRINITY_DN1282_c0_g1_i1.p1 TRINITY_DN1282_c0_g1~~TRINITY_DN1282_c0_g1_i1.p1  ORF type:complete len:367 (+),score=-47.50 TRINITY_DN1282_c0_g1_i1:77-1177(+)
MIQISTQKHQKLYTILYIRNLFNKYKIIFIKYLYKIQNKFFFFFFFFTRHIFFYTELFIKHSLIYTYIQAFFKHTHQSIFSNTHIIPEFSNNRKIYTLLLLLPIFFRTYYNIFSQKTTFLLNHITLLGRYVYYNHHFFIKNSGIPLSPIQKNNIAQHYQIHLNQKLIYIILCLTLSYVIYKSVTCIIGLYFTLMYQYQNTYFFKNARQSKNFTFASMHGNTNCKMKNIWSVQKQWCLPSQPNPTWKFIKSPQYIIFLDEKINKRIKITNKTQDSAKIHHLKRDYNRIRSTLAFFLNNNKPILIQTFLEQIAFVVDTDSTYNIQIDNDIRIIQTTQQCKKIMQHQILNPGPCQGGQNLFNPDFRLQI